MMFQPDVSVLIPTRGRAQRLDRAVRALCETAESLERIEILYRLDSDDLPTIEAAHRLSTLAAGAVVVGERGGGYRDLYRYYNELCSRARGRFLLLYNDDCTMATSGWDRIIAAQRAQMSVLRPRAVRGEWPVNCFPILSRDIYEQLGHISLNSHCDLWAWVLTRWLGLEVSVPIEIDHDKHSREGGYLAEGHALLDETERAMRQTLRETYQAFVSYENYQLLEADARRLAPHLTSAQRLAYWSRLPRIRFAQLRRKYRQRYPALESADRGISAIRRAIRLTPVP